MRAFFKRDFNSVMWALNGMVGKELPVWVCLIYYVIMLPIGLALYPIAKLWSMIFIWKLKRLIAKEMETY